MQRFIIIFKKISSEQARVLQFVDKSYNNDHISSSRDKNLLN